MPTIGIRHTTKNTGLELKWSLSRYINLTKNDYHQILRQIRDTGNWEPSLFYMLKAVSSTAKHTTSLIGGISQLLAKQKQLIRGDYSSIVKI